MPYITNTSLVHVGPVPKGPGKARRAKKAVESSRAVKGIKRKAKHTYYNATSTKTTNMAGETIGKKPPKHRDNKPSFEMNSAGAQWGAVGGLVAGGTAGAAAGKKKYPESKEWKQGVHNVRKSYTRITDVGTAAGRAAGPKATRWPRFPGPAIAAGVAAGGAGGYGLQKLEYKERQKQVQRYKKKKQPVAKAGRLMSDAEIRRRKKLQGTISHATGALGLTALGGTLLATKTGSKGTKAAFKAVGRSRPKALKPKNLKRGTAPILATGAGIGGAGSFNFAAYTNAESRKRKMATVSKIGEWKTIDQRELSQRRARKYMRGAGAAVGAGTGLVLLHRKPGDAQKVMQTGKMVRHALKGPAKAKVKAGNVGRIIRQDAAQHTSGAKIGAAGVVGGVAVGGAAKTGHTYQQHKINERRRTHYKASLKKSASTSAFGVDHG
jgi:hypothetical protein